VNIGWLRQFHLKRDWSNAGDAEWEMAFENLVFVTQNYKKHGYQNVLLEDLNDTQVARLSRLFPCSLVITLYLSDEAELKRRVLDETRDSGYRDYEKSLAWNRHLQELPLLPNEHRIDNLQPFETTVTEVKGLMESRQCQSG
jgi:hypothetical protein